MGAHAEATICGALRQCAESELWSPTRHVVDIASPEELWKHDGPLLAEDCYKYHFDTDAAIFEPEPDPALKVASKELPEERLEEHVKKVFEKIEERKKEEVLRRFDSAMRTAAHRVDLLDHLDLTEEQAPEHAGYDVMRGTMASLQAVQEHLEWRTRANAAVQAANERAAVAAGYKDGSRHTKAAAKSGFDPIQARIQEALSAAQSRHATEAKFREQEVLKKTATNATTTSSKSTRRSEAPETLESRISRVMAEAQQRSVTQRSKVLSDAPHQKEAFSENFEEQTTSASSYSATDSGEESGAERQSSLWWSLAPR